MGCRTGCYLVMFGNLDSEDVLDLVLEMCDFIIGFEGEIPGAAPEQCGNYQEQNLDMAKYYIKKYKDALVNDRHLVYPE
jgi:S-ribosylhomocysteine lyase